MLLQLSTWCEVDNYLESSSGIVIPIGSTEQHGPSGLIGTDAICPEKIAQGLSQEHGIMVAPTLSIGMAQHHLGFAGSITLRPSTLILVIKDVINSLARHGFDSFYFLNGHGGNIATINAAFAEVYAESSLGEAPSNRPPLRFKLRNWWSAPGAQRLSRELYGSSEGSHATPSEVSLSYYAYPDAVKSVQLSPRLAPNGRIRDANDYRQQFPDGRIGSDPSLANVKDGERIYTAAVADLARDYQDFVASPISS